MVNEGSALWSRPRSDIDEDQYREFYHHIAHMPGDPWHTIHLHAEGRIEYAALLFVPDTTPFDLFDPIRQHRVRLYVRRVFITDECEGLIPPYLRFMRGVVDSSDLALNVSRETLQNDPILAKIRTGLVKRVFSELEKRAKKTPEEYTSFWENFGAVLKEGLYEDAEQKDRLLPLVRFRSTGGGERWLSLDDYVDAMPEQQEAIYYMSGEDADALRRSPQIEGFRARGIDVLLMVDPVDQFWLPVIGTYKEKPFRSVTQGAADLDKFAVSDEAKPDEADTTPPGEMDKLIALVKLTLADAVKDVRTSDRLTDSPVCLVADEGDLDMHLGAAAASAQTRAAGAEARAGDQSVTRPDPRAGADGRAEGGERGAGGRRAPVDGSGAYPRRRAGVRSYGLHQAPLGSWCRVHWPNNEPYLGWALDLQLSSSQTMSAPMMRPLPRFSWTRTAQPSPMPSDRLDSSSGPNSSVMAPPVQRPMERKSRTT